MGPTGICFTIFTIIFFVWALTISYFYYGKKAYELHDDEKEANKKKMADSKSRQRNQIWLNGLGAFIGWAFLYYFLIFRLHLFWPNFQIWGFKAETLDLFILLIVFLGITGYLPYVAILRGVFKSS